MIINNAGFRNLPDEVTWKATLLPFYGIFMLACGFAAGILALIAIIWRRERSWPVWFALLPGLFVLILLLGEFLFPH
jgi:peptidoglycan/LPS O-acetylase OafA/YrhL